VTSGTRQRYRLRLGRRSRFLLILWGVRQSSAYVDIDHVLHARFGFYRLTTPIANITHWRLEGPWRWVTAIGVRLGVRHRDLTFGGTHMGGARLDFRRAVRWGPFSVPALYVTVEDLEGFAKALADRGIPGEDAREE